MATIMLPTMAAFEGDADKMLKILEKHAKDSHRIGLEVIGKSTDFQNQEGIDAVKKGVEAVRNRVDYLTVHGFSGGDVYDTKLADMRTDAGVKLLTTYFNIAKDAGADYVHVHSAAGYKGVRGDIPLGEKYEGIKLPENIKRQELMKVRENLIKCANAFPSIKGGIENLPFPSMCDVEKDPDKVWCDCVDSLDDCLEIVKGTNLGVTYDVCHHAMNEQQPIDLVAGARKLIPYLEHLHVSDTEGIWTPYKTLVKEGLIPGDGRIGSDSFRNFFEFIRGNCPYISICAEIWPNDFKNPIEIEKTVQRIVGWLKH